MQNLVGMLLNQNDVPQFSPPSTMGVGVVQSVPITTNVMNSNPAYGGVYSIQHYVITFNSDTP
jgi:hypothetical protein